MPGDWKKPSIEDQEAGGEAPRGRLGENPHRAGVGGSNPLLKGPAPHLDPKLPT